MRSAGIDHQVGVQRADCPIIARADVDSVAIAMCFSSHAECSHLGTLEERDILEPSTEVEYGRLDERPARIELPQSRMATPRPSVGQPRSDIPSRLYWNCSRIEHLALEAWKEGFVLQQPASQQVVEMAGLWHAL